MTAKPPANKPANGTTIFPANKRVNFKALIILLGAMAVLGVGVHFLHAFQVKRNARDSYVRAERLYKQAKPEKEGGKLDEAKLDEALLYLRQYLGMAPQDIEAQVMLGDWLNESPQFRQKQLALYAYDQVLGREPERDNVREKAAKLAINLRRFGEARENLKILVSNRKGDPKLYHMYGLCETGAGQYTEAAKWYKKAIKLDEKNVEFSRDFAAMLREGLQATGLADDEMERLVSADPKSVDARFAASRHYFRAGNFEKAVEHVQYCLNASPSPTEETFELAADIAVFRNKPEEARSAYEAGLKLYPANKRLTLGIARLELSAGRPKEAAALLEPSVAKLSDDPEMLWSLGNLLVDSGKPDKAGSVISKLTAKGLEPQANFLKARILVRQDAWGEASKILEATGERLPNREVLGKHVYLLLAECYQRLENPDRCLEACRQALDRDPNWPPARRLLAEGLAAQGKTELALKEYDKLPEHDRPEWKRAVAGLMLSRNLSAADRKRNWQGVEQLLDQLSPEEKAKFETKILRANILVQEGKLDEASAFLMKERDLDPKAVPPWVSLIRLAEMQQQSSEAAKLAIPYLVDRAESASGPNVEWQLARVRYLTNKSSVDVDALAELKQMETHLGTLKPADADRLRLSLADRYVSLGKAEDADRLWTELAKNQPNNASIRFRLLERAYYGRNADDVNKWTKELRQIECGEGPLTAYGEAAYLILQAQLAKQKVPAEAGRLLAKAATMRRPWPGIAVLEAEALVDPSFNLKEIAAVDANAKNQAVEKYKAALNLGERRLGVVRRALWLMYDQREFRNAIEILRALPDAAVYRGGLDFLAANLLVSVADDDSARSKKERSDAWEHARRSIKDSKDYLGYLWLGQIAALTGKDREAEEAFRKACDLNDAIPDTWASLILFLASRKKTSEAEAELVQAQAKLSPKQAPLALAPAYEALGKLDLAEKQYEALLTASPDDPLALRNLAAFMSRTGQLVRSEPILQKLLEPKTKAPKDATLWARTMLAVTLASRGGYQRFKDAERLLEENTEQRKKDKEQGPNSSDEFAKALVLATQPSQRKEAIKLCEKLADTLPAASADLQFTLAQLYEMDGNWPKAKAQMLHLLEVQDKNPVYLARYSQGLLNQGELQQAQSYVNKLAAVAPDAPATLAIRVRLLKTQGKKDAAAKLVLAYTGQKAARLDLAAALLDDIGYGAEAEKLYLEILASDSKRADATYKLAEHLAKHERFDEALELCQQGWKNLSPEIAASMTVTVVRAGKPSAEQIKKVENLLEPAVAANPKNLLLHAIYAQFLDQLGREAEAMKLYDDILSKDTKNVVALNNLAFMLGLKKQRLDEALKLINRAIEEAGPQSTLLDSRAVIFLQKGDTNSAIRDLLQAIAQDPRAPYYYHLARAYYQSDKASFREAMNNAKSLGIQASQLHPLEHVEFEVLAFKVKDAN
jgi:cellulose synthase operon protein C